MEIPGEQLRKILSAINMILIFLIIILILDSSFTVKALSHNVVTENFWNVKTFAYGGTYDEKINGTQSSYKFSIIDLLPINKSIYVSNESSLQEEDTVVYLKMFNPEILSKNTTVPYYYRSKLCFIDSSFLTLSDIESIPEPTFVIMNPYEFGDKYLGEISRTISLLENQSSLSIDFIIKTYGWKSIDTLVLENNSRFFPFFGPYEGDYYYNLVIQQRELANTMASIQKEVAGLSLSFLNDYKIVPWKEDESVVNIENATLSYEFNLSLVNENFSLEVYDYVEGTYYGKIMNNSVSLVIQSNVKFQDFRDHTTLEIKKRWGVEFLSIEEMTFLQQKQGALDITVSRFIASFLIISLIIRRFHKKRIAR